MYKVDVSPAANSVLEEYTFRCARDNGEECAFRLLDAYDEKCVKIEYIIDDRQNYGTFLK